MGEYKPITNAEPVDIESGTIKNIDESKKSSRPAQHRLVSLDVFRGITVAVCSYLHSFILLLFVINFSKLGSFNLFWFMFCKCLSLDFLFGSFNLGFMIN